MTAKQFTEHAADDAVLQQLREITAGHPYVLLIATPVAGDDRHGDLRVITSAPDAENVARFVGNAAACLGVAVDDENAPTYVHFLLDALIAGRPLDFRGAPVPLDVQARLEAGTWQHPMSPAERTTADLRRRGRIELAAAVDEALHTDRAKANVVVPHESFDDDAGYRARLQDEDDNRYAPVDDREDAAAEESAQAQADEHPVNLADIE